MLIFPMLIRPATAADLPAITAIYARSVEEEFASFELTPPTMEEMGSRMNALQNGNYPYLVAEISGEVSGYGYASAYRPRPAYANTVENTVYVAKEHWRRGIANALLTALMDECAHRGFRQMIAVIACRPDTDLQESASIKLHQKAGFQISGRLKEVGFKQGLWLDVVLMQRKL